MTEGDDRPTMGDVSHTHPYTGETFGGIYRRGPAIADGGERPSATASAGEQTQTMRDVNHVAPDGEGVARVWKRGAPEESE